LVVALTVFLTFSIISCVISSPVELRAASRELRASQVLLHQLSEFETNLLLRL
jgi:hypothetical protein